jgi:Trp operon repressor
VFGLIEALLHFFEADQLSVIAHLQRMRKPALSLMMKFSTLMPNEQPPNLADLDRAGANFQGRLTEDRVHQIIRLLLEGQTQSAIAKQFGVAETTIHRIARGEAWKQVPRPTNFASAIRHSTAKLTEAQVREIRHLLKAGDTQQVVSRKFNVGQSTISDIATGRNWSWLPHD